MGQAARRTRGKARKVGKHSANGTDPGRRTQTAGGGRGAVGGGGASRSVRSSGRAGRAVGAKRRATGRAGRQGGSGREAGGGRKTAKKAGKKPATPRSGRTQPARANRQGGSDGRAVFPALDRKRPQWGLGTFIVVAEGLGHTNEVAVARTEAFGASPGPGAAARRFSSKARLDELARVLSAFGNPHRLEILTALLYGPATYRTLQRASKLKAGPFYHHINQLRLAGFLGPKTRDLYVLTRAGRNALLVALSLAPLLKDRRIRPLPETADE